MSFTRSLKRIVVVGGLGLVMGLAVPVLAQQQASPGAAAAYASAAALQDRGVYDLAAKEWQALLRDFPRDPLAARAGYNLGVCRFQSGDFAAAAEAFEKAAGTPGADAIADSCWANLGLARFNLAASLPAGQARQSRATYQQAIAAFDKLLADFPQSPQVASAEFYRAESLTALGDHTKAAEGYRRVIDNQTAAALRPAALLGLASAELEAGRPDKAMGAAAVLIESKPEGELAGEAYRLLGEAQLAKGKFTEAAEAFGRAAQARGYSAANEALERRGFALYSAEQYGQAAIAYEQLAGQLQKQTARSGALLSAGKCRMLAGERKQALAILAKLWQANPTADNAEAAHWLAQTLFESKQYQQAALTADQALLASPDKRWALPMQMTLADSLYELSNQRERALQTYQSIAQASPDSPQGERAAYLAAHTALELGQYEQAFQLAVKYHQRHAGSKLTIDVRLIAAESALRLKRPKDAAAQFETLLRESADDTRANDWSLRLASLQRAENNWAAIIGTLQPRIDSFKQEDLQRGLSMLAEAQRNSGDARAAEATLGRLIDTGSDATRVAPALYQRGEQRAAANRVREANADFAALVERFPRHQLAPFALYALASNQIEAGAKGNAEKSLNQLVSNYNDGPVGKARYLLAGLLQERGRHAEALRMLIQAEAPEPELLYRRALALGETGDKAQARATYEKLLQQYPQHELADQALSALAWLVREVDPPLAAKLFAKLATDYPNSPLVGEALLRVGEARYEQKEFDQASQTLARAAQAESASPGVRSQSLHLLGWSRFEQQDYAGALDTFQQQLALNQPGEQAANATAMIGECHYALEQWGQALTAYQPTKKAPPANKRLTGLAWMHAGQAAGQLGKWEESLRWLDLASRADSDGAPTDEVAYERGWALYNLRRMDNARPIFEKLAAAGTNVLSARSQFLLGEIEFAEKQYETAVRTFFRVAYGYGGRDAPEAYHTWQAESLFEAARCLELLDRQAPARKLYAELLERFPDSPKAHQARSRLQSGALR